MGGVGSVSYKGEGIGSSAYLKNNTGFSKLRVFNVAVYKIGQ